MSNITATFSVAVKTTKYVVSVLTDEFGIPLLNTGKGGTRYAVFCGISAYKKGSGSFVIPFSNDGVFFKGDATELKEPVIEAGIEGIPLIEYLAELAKPKVVAPVAAMVTAPVDSTLIQGESVAGHYDAIIECLTTTPVDIKGKACLQDLRSFVSKTSTQTAVNRVYQAFKANGKGAEFIAFLGDYTLESFWAETVRRAELRKLEAEGISVESNESNVAELPTKIF